MARQRTTSDTPQPRTEGDFKCPECGRTFTRAAALGAHRRQAHGVAGATTRARSARRPRRTAAAAKSSAAAATTRRRRPNRAAASSTRGRRDGSVDRNALLQQLFPNGIPAKEEVIREVNNWLDEAERLARIK
jgi:uncharacterized C2H2 Zn-finger protein